MPTYELWQQRHADAQADADRLRVALADAVDLIERRLLPQLPSAATSPPCSVS